MELNFKELSENLENILIENLGTEFLVNPFFRISKATPEQMHPYFMVMRNLPRPVILLTILIQIPWYALKLAIGLTLSIIFNHQYRGFDCNSHQRINLFLSHGTPGNLTDQKKDRFFDVLPEKISIHGQVPSTVVYTNQSNFRYKKDIKLLQQKNPSTSHVLLPKFLKFKENLDFISNVSLLASRCVYVGISLYLRDSTRSKILLASTSSFFTRKTYANYLLRERMREFYQNKLTVTFFLTFEGHGYEQMLIDDALKYNKETLIYLYQHSPIVPYHFGIRNHLNHLDGKACVLTTGAFYQEYLQSISSKCNFIVLGSNKASYTKSYAVPETELILYAPEGTLRATFDILKLIHKLSMSLNDHTHVLRLHPDLKTNSLVKIALGVLKNHSNFRLSKSDLSSDLESSKFLLYRSSAVGIEALNYKTKPIFYAKPILNGLNVLFMDNSLHYQAVDADDVISLIKLDFSETLFNKQKKKLQELITNLNYERILKFNLE